MRVFIDTNIYLGFIKLSQEKLESLEELKKLLKENKFSLIFPKITQDELFRNIPAIMQEQTVILNSQLPIKKGLAVSQRGSEKEKKINKFYDEYCKLIEELKDDYIKSVDSLIKKVIDPLILDAADIHEDLSLIEAAQTRRLRGNPPGKIKGPIGDEIEWELLLSKCTDEDLTIIANDGDWKNPNKSKGNELHPFLLKEWGKFSNKKITLFSSLGEFINKLTKKEKITKEDIRKEKVITHTISSYVGGAGEYTPYNFTVKPSDYEHWMTISPSNASTATTTTTTSSGLTYIIGTAAPFICNSCGRQVMDGKIINGVKFCNSCTV